MTDKPMTVGELIYALSDLPIGLPVFIEWERQKDSPDGYYHREGWLENCEGSHNASEARVLLKIR